MIDRAAMHVRVIGVMTTVVVVVVVVVEGC